MVEPVAQALRRCLFQVPEHAVHAIHVESRVEGRDLVRAPPPDFVPEQPAAFFGCQADFGHLLHVIMHDVEAPFAPPIGRFVNTTERLERFRDADGEGEACLKTPTTS